MNPRRRSAVAAIPMGTVAAVSFLRTGSRLPRASAVEHVSFSFPPSKPFHLKPSASAGLVEDTAEFATHPTFAVPSTYGKDVYYRSVEKTMQIQADLGYNSTEQTGFYDAVVAPTYYDDASCNPPSTAGGDYGDAAWPGDGCVCFEPDLLESSFYDMSVEEQDVPSNAFGYRTAFNTSVTGGLTVEGWFRASNTSGEPILAASNHPGNQHSHILTRGKLASWNAGFSLGLGKGSGFRLGVILEDDPVDGSRRTLTAESPNYSWFPGIDVWHHVVGMYDADAGRISVYVDGVLQGETFADPTWTRAERDVKWGTNEGQAGMTRMGNGYDSNDKNFFGCLGGMALYSGVATTAPLVNGATDAPSSSPTGQPTKEPTSQPTDALIISQVNHRCGVQEIDARELCGQPCTHSIQCSPGQQCHVVHQNYCGSIPDRTYADPVQSAVRLRCGKSEVDARTFCGTPCSFAGDCTVEGEACYSVNPNYCGSEYTTDNGTGPTTSSPSTSPTTGTDGCGLTASNRTAQITAIALGTSDSPGYSSLLSNPSTPQGRALNFTLSDPAASGLCPDVIDNDYRGGANAVRQMYILSVFYFSTSGDGWTDNSGWLESNSTCDWHGVSCIVSDSDEVAKLELDENNLVGTLPSELGRLDTLLLLDLGNGVGPSNDPTNNFSNGIPTEIFALTNVAYFRLTNTQLTGSIPTEIGQLSRTTQIFFDQNHITGTIPTEIQSMSMLRKLWLNGNEIVGPLPTQLGKLSAMWQLMCEDCEGLEGTIPTELGNLTLMKRLDLRNTGLSGSIPPELSNLVDLTHLQLDKSNSLSGTVPVCDGPSFGGAFPNLDTVTADCKAVTCTCCNGGSGCPTIGSPHTESPTSGPSSSPTSQPKKEPTSETTDACGLTASNRTAQITAIALGVSDLSLLSDPSTPQGRALNFTLSDPAASGLCPNINDDDYKGGTNAVRQMYLLSVLYFSTAGESWTNNSEWLESNRTCDWYGVSCTMWNQDKATHLALYENNLVGTLPLELGRLDTLGLLNLGNGVGGTANNVFGNRIPTEIFTLSNLAFFKLTNTQLTGSIPTEIGQLSSATQIYLDWNHLTSTIPTEIGGLSASLKKLWLSGNDLAGPLPTQLGSLSLLRELTCQNCENLDGTIPTELGGLTLINRLVLRRTGLSGNVPSELGNLVALTHLQLEESSNLSGIVPVCDGPSFGGAFPDLVTVTADCQVVSCTCCTGGNSCPLPGSSSNPTRSPTVAPVTTSPSGSPSKSPVTPDPTSAPSSSPSKDPTVAPITGSPTTGPSKSPSALPSASPTTAAPSSSPTKTPSGSPNTAAPTSLAPSGSPTKSPIRMKPRPEPSASDPMVANGGPAKTSSPTSPPTQSSQQGPNSTPRTTLAPATTLIEAPTPVVNGFRVIIPTTASAPTPVVNGFRVFIPTTASFTNVNCDSAGQEYLNNIASAVETECEALNQNTVESCTVDVGSYECTSWNEGRNLLRVGGSRELATSSLVAEFVATIKVHCDAGCSVSGYAAQDVANQLVASFQNTLRAGARDGSLISDLRESSSEVAALLGNSNAAFDFGEAVTTILTELLGTWFPDWHGGSGKCLNDGNEPYYMVYNDYTTRTLGACCQNYYSWDPYQCCGVLDIIPSGYYPNLGDSSSNVKCLASPEETPAYMVQNLRDWIYNDIESCCTAHYDWAKNECIVNSGGIPVTTTTAPNQWFVSWALKKCVKNCDASSSDTKCGGYAENWDSMFSTASECCERLWYVERSECTL